MVRLRLAVGFGPTIASVHEGGKASELGFGEVFQRFSNSRWSPMGPKTVELASDVLEPRLVVSDEFRIREEQTLMFEELGN